jgi:YD repeat-containing protein
MASRIPLVRIVFAAVLVLFVLGGARAQSAVQYVYDELGRLTGVVNTSGNAAAYSYDPVGNLLSITNYSASQASVLQFTPTSGPVGTTVTLYGTGFSTTISSDSVSFGGTSATITSATANQMVTTVPTGASTGTISITTPAGTFTTATNFTVTTSTGAPTITSFTPTVASPGTSISISGTNFSSTAANDQLKFNITRQFASSATSTGISTTVPVATSGHVQVATSAGSAVSSQDLYVPFGTFTASQVGYSNRTTLGTSATVSATGASQIGLLIFDATAGQRVSLSLSGSTLTYCYYVYLFAPDGTQIGSDACPTSPDFLDALTAPYTGTYTVGVNFTANNSSGGVTITPNNATDATGTISIGGSAVTMTTTAPGQNIAVTFSGTAGHAVSVLSSGQTFSTAANLWVYAPDGTPLASPSTISTSGLPLFTGPLNLPETGTYKIYVDPSGTGTGQVTLQLFDSTPITGTITPGGSSVTATTTSYGEDAIYTFTGTASERISLTIQSVSYSTTLSGFYSPSATVAIIKPNGTTLASTVVYTSSSTTYFIDTQVLPTAGTYTVRVAPGPYTGTATLTLYQVPADASATITINGSPVVISTSTPGQNLQLTFSGTSGQSISLTCGSVTYSNYNPLVVYNPSTSYLTSGYVYPTGNTIFTGVTLSQTGTFTITVDPSGTDTGSVTFQLTSP